MKPFDEIAVQEAGRLKEAGVATEAVAVSVGVADGKATIARPASERFIQMHRVT